MRPATAFQWICTALLFLALAACGSDYDEAAPRLELDAEPPGFTNQAPLELSGTMESGATLEVEILYPDGASEPVQPEVGEAVWRVEVTLEEGGNIVSVTARDVAGNFHLIRRTVVLDTAPPAIESREPEPEASVPVPADVRVTFSEPVKSVALAVSGPGGEEVTGTLAPDLEAQEETPALSFVWTPDAPLAAGAAYTVSLAPGTVDRAGNAINGESWTFLTSEETP